LLLGSGQDGEELVSLELKEYEILFDTGKCRKLVAQINSMAREGWQAKSISNGIEGTCVLMEREVS
jgi:hypothetical protein